MSHDMSPEAVADSLKAQRAWMNPEPTTRPAVWNYEYTRPLKAYRVFNPEGKEIYQTTEHKVAKIVCQNGNQALEAIKEANERFKGWETIKKQRNEALTAIELIGQKIFEGEDGQKILAEIINPILAKYSNVEP